MELIRNHNHLLHLIVILFLVLVSSENTLAMKGRIIYEGIINFSDSINKKEQQSNHPASKTSQSATKKTERFLVKSADARMMDAAEGKLAVEKGTTE